MKAPNWIGDAVMAGPFIRAVRARWPRAHLAVLARVAVRPVVERTTDFDEMVREERHAVWGLSRKLRAGCYDMAFSLSSSQGVALAMRMAGIPVRVGFGGGLRGAFWTRPVPPLSREVHCIRHYLALLEMEGGVPVAVRVPEWRVAGADRAKAGVFLRRNGWRGRGKLVAFAPGAVFGPAKRWFIARWVELGDRLALERGVNVVLVGGPSERGIAGSIGGLMARRPLDATGRLDLAGTAALLAGCAGCVSNDSGLAHVSAAVGTPTLTLVGSTSPEWTAPQGRRAEFIRERVACAPCFRRTCLPGRDYDCLRGLTVDMVETRLIQIAELKAR